MTGRAVNPFDHYGPADRITYRGFDGPEGNPREVELWLGDAFETHIPSGNRIAYRDANREEHQAQPGDRLVRHRGEIVNLGPDEGDE